MLLCYLKSYSNCCIISFKRIETEEVFTFELSNNYNDFKSLLQFFNSNRNEIFIGYNMENFYNIVFNFILNKALTLIENKATIIAYYIYNIASNIYSESIDKNWKYPKYYHCIDLLKILTERESSITLTEIEMYLDEENIEDFKYTSKDAVIEYKIVDLKKYCISKLNVLNKLYDLSKKNIEYRFLLNKEYNINILNKYNAGIGKIIIEKTIINNDKINKEELFNLKNKELENLSFKLEEIIIKDISFQTIEFNKLLNDLKKFEITKSNLSINYKFNYKENNFIINDGGLEFKQNKTIFDTEEKEFFIRIDIKNAYPTFMYNHDLYPSFLPDTFKDVFKYFYEQRIDKTKDKKITKIPLLGIVGNFNSPNSFLYSPKTFISVVLNTKLAILKLIEDFYLKDIEIIYVKSDEVIIKTKSTNFVPIVNEWSKKFNLEVKFDAFEKIIATNINDMILYKKGYKEDFSLIETKGIFNLKSKKIGVNKDAPIIYKCIIEYFGKNISINDFLKKENDIRDYLFFYKFNKQFKIINKNENIEENRIGRFFISKKGYKIYKNNIEKKTFLLLNDNNIILNNDSFKKEEINKIPYYHEIIKLKNIIQPLQQNLF